MSRARKPRKTPQTAPPLEAQCRPEATPHRVGEPGRAEAHWDQADLTQERSRDLLETAEAIVWEAEAATLELTYVSRGAETILGFGPEEWRGTPDFWANHLHPEDRERALGCAREVQEKGQALQVEYRMAGSDGCFRWFRDSMQAVKGREGNPDLLRGIMIEITPSKGMEQALRESEKRYKDFIAHTGEGVWRLEFERPLPLDLPEEEFLERFFQEAYIAECNLAHARNLGYTSAREVEGKRVRDVNPSLDLDKGRRESFRSALRSGFQSRTVEFCGLDKAGAPRQLLRTEVPIVENGSLVRMWGITRDVTELRRAEEELRLTRFSLERASDAVFWMNPQGRIVYVNEAACRSLGYSREELLALSIPDIDPRFSREAWQNAWEKVKQQGSVTHETQHRTKQGNVFPVEITATHLEFEGKEYSFAFARDITERQRAQEALRQQRAELEAAQRLAHIGSWLWDVGTDEASWSEETYRIFGQRPGILEHHGIRFVEMLHPDDRVRVGQALTDALEGKAGYDLEYRLVRPDGEERIIHAQAEVVRDAAGRATFMRGTVQDITERKRAEDALIEERHLLHTLMDNLPDLIYFKDRQSRLTRINLALARKFNLDDPAQAVGKTDFDFFSAEQAREYYNDEQRIIRTGQPILGKEESATYADGEYACNSTTKMPLRDAHGNIVGTFGVSRDLTARKRAEAALGKSEERFRLFMNNNPASTWMKDKQGRYVYISETYQKYLGVRPEDRVGKTDFEVYPRANAEQYTASDQAALAAGHSIAVIEEGIRHDGKSCSWLTYKFPFQDASGQVLVAGIGLDITERKQAEDALRRANDYNRSLLEASLDPLVTIAPDGKIADVNTATENVTGRTRDELIGTEFCDYFTDAEMARAGYQKVFHEGLVRDYELEIRHHDGHTIPVLYNAAVYRDEAGSITGVFAAARDITERKRAEEARAYLSSIVECSDDAIIGKSCEGVIQSWNKGAERLYGYAASEMIGEPIYRLVPPDRTNEIMSLLERVRAGKVIEHHETVRVCKDGTLIDVSVTISPIRDARGLITGASTVTRNITERKRAEAALQASERRLHTVMEEAPVAINISRAGRSLYANQRCLKMFGFKSAAELAEHTVSEHWAPEWRPIIAERARQRALGLPVPTQYEGMGQRQDGSQFPVEISVASVGLPDGGANIAFLTDITERRRAERVLSESEERFRTLIEEAPLGIRISRDGRTVYTNRKYLAMYGYQRAEELAGLTLEGQWAPESRPAVQERIERRLQGLPLPPGLEGVAQRRDGSQFRVRADVTQVNLPDGPASLSFFSDITERQEAQENKQRFVEQLRALAARLQTVREEESTRLAREIHDQLGQALTALKVDVSFLLSELPAGPGPWSRRTSSIAQLIDQTIQTVREISSQLRPGMLDHLGLAATVEWAVEDFGARTGIKCRFDLTEEELALDSDRATAIYRILQELLTNVARHAAATEVEVQLEKQNHDVVLKVRDNGKGMAMDRLSARESLGILGMRERALAFGGELVIGSELGTGTRVRVRIPEAGPAS